MPFLFASSSSLIVLVLVVLVLGLLVSGVIEIFEKQSTSRYAHTPARPYASIGVSASGEVRLLFKRRSVFL